MTQGEPYNKWIEEALLFVVWKALKETETEGLPLDHHYFLTFETDRPDVKITKQLKEKYPKEITIVLQHSFENLKVTGTPYDGQFEITLSFNGKLEHLVVPFVALIGFSDPPANFGLHFTPKPPKIKKEKERVKQISDKVVEVDFRKNSKK